MMFTLTNLRKYFRPVDHPSRPCRQVKARPCPEQLEGRELMAAFGGHAFAARLQQLHSGAASVRQFRAANAASLRATTQARLAAVTTTSPGTRPGRIVRDPSLISRVDPFGAYQTRNAVIPSAANPSGGPSKPVTDPSLVSPADPFGAFRTNDALVPTGTNPSGGPSKPISDPSLISPVDPYGQYRTN